MIASKCKGSHGPVFPSAGSDSSATHRCQVKSKVMQRLLLGSVHAMGKLSEYSMHILHDDAENDDFIALHQHGKLERRRWQDSCEVIVESKLIISH